MDYGRLEKMAKKTEVQDINDSDFESIIKKNNLVVVDFYADWCMPCVMMSPIVDELAQTYAGKISFFKINVDDNKASSAKFRVMGIPTLLIFKNGQLVDRNVGASSFDILQERLKKYLS
ncbi:thioredoxin [Candidatus Pacearchaeota archaeon]|nr:thioredoxin [Candidatus Pacearchaeota archaeon]